MMFRKGDDVEVWSKSRERWMRGSVTQIVENGTAAGQKEATPPSVRVNLGGHQDKMVDPTQMDQIRFYVPFEIPVDSELPPSSFFRTLRDRYFAAEGQIAYPIGLSTLERMWRDSVQEAGSITQNEKDLIHTRLKKSFLELNVSCHLDLGEEGSLGSVDLCEWLHHTLMRLHSPGPDTARVIAEELSSAGPKTLSRLVTRWMRMDKAGSGLICKDNLAEAFRQEFRPRLSVKLAERMAVRMLHDLSAAGLGQGSYSEFVLRCLGVECAEVVLYYYDLSNDWATYLSPLLLGSKESGLWHTGVAAFSREYFYGGRIFYGPPCATIWGRPNRAMRLGLTTRRIDDLREHIFIDLDRKFDRKNYDVLECNCNHFSNSMVRFLLGRGIPDEVLQQPERVMGAPVAKMFRPLLNHWLGRIDQGKSEEDAAKPKRGTKGGA